MITICSQYSTETPNRTNSLPGDHDDSNHDHNHDSAHDHSSHDHNAHDHTYEDHIDHDHKAQRIWKDYLNWEIKIYKLDIDC